MRNALALLVATILSSGIPPAHAQIPDSLAKIGHIVVIFEENHSFDNLFGNFPGSDGLENARNAPKQVDRDGHVYATLPPVMDTNLTPPGPDPRFPVDLANAPFRIDGYVSEKQKTGDLIHAWYQEQLQIDGGRMDKFVAWSNASSLVMGYFDASKTENWKLASEYTLGDRMFHSAFGGSYLNHAYLVCSCAFRFPGAPASMVSQPGRDGVPVKDGQVTPDGYGINTSRSIYLHAPTDTDLSKLVPPQTMPHIGDRLDAKGVSWAWYSGGYDDAMAGHPDPLFQFHHQALAFFQDLAPGSEGQKKHLKDYKDLLIAIYTDTLPQVSFYKPIGQFNLHPGYTNVSDGDAHLGEIVARLQKSPNWSDMLIIVTYDENGGQWDHVAPPKRDAWGPGTRVPLIAIGPTVKRHFIDHTTYDFGSILRTITLRFAAEPVASADANATPMTNLLQ